MRFVVFIIGLFLATVAHGGDRWNLLLITADDMNADSSGWNGNPLKLTPNLDAFATSAQRFVNNHNTCPICQPGREALLTGRVPHRSGALGFNPINRDVPTLVEVLQTAGYFTAALEKIPHMAPAEKFPWDEKHAGQIGKDPTKLREAFRSTLASAVVSQKPFFINANITDPHRPFFGVGGKKAAKGDGVVSGIQPLKASEITVPSFLEDLPAIREEVAQYYSSVKRFDVSFGGILEELKEAGRLEDTVVMFWSDHGMSFPFSKATVYRNGTWSPVVVRYPGLKEPREFREFTSSVDVMPSLLELLKITPPPGMDGRSWVPLLQGERQDDRDFVITHVNTVSSGKSLPQRCVRTKDYSLMFHAWPDGTEKFRVEAMSGLTFAAMKEEPKVQQRVQQLVVGEPLMFFDMTADPDERVNQIRNPKFADMIQQMSKKLLAHMERTNDPQTAAFKEALAKR